MKIVKIQTVDSHKTGAIFNLSRSAIEKKLGIAPEELGDEKVEYEWMFSADGQECAIWDWKGSGAMNMHSAFGPAEKLRELFGSNYRHGSF